MSCLGDTKAESEMKLKNYSKQSRDSFFMHNISFDIRDVCFVVLFLNTENLNLYKIPKKKNVIEINFKSISIELKEDR
jgi:hypothetical protein